MCGRYLTPTEIDFERFWGISVPPDYFPSFNVAPSQLAPVIRLSPEGELRADLLSWGFQPGWAKRPWINARAETLFETKAFASAAKKRRCLVPAVGWYEWQGSQAPRQPYVFHRPEFAPFAFAGIWTGKQTEAGWDRSFAIVTTSAVGPATDIHHRFPLIVAQDNHAAWLTDATPMTELEAVLAYEASDIAFYPVSTYVNKPDHDDEDCLKPLAALSAAQE